MSLHSPLHTTPVYFRPVHRKDWTSILIGRKRVLESASPSDEVGGQPLHARKWCRCFHRVCFFPSQGHTSATRTSLHDTTRSAAVQERENYVTKSRQRALTSHVLVPSHHHGGDDLHRASHRPFRGYACFFFFFFFFFFFGKQEVVVFLAQPPPRQTTEEERN